MNIFVYMNDYLISIIILATIIFGTRLVNYYYNFYHIYNYLDYEQKISYFKSNYLINMISKYHIVKKVVVYYLLIPLIKFNYLFISIFITLLYSLCYQEFKKIIKEQQQKKHTHKKSKKKTYNYILSESNDNAINNNLSIDNIETIQQDNIEEKGNKTYEIGKYETEHNEIFENEIQVNDILNVNKIDSDFNDGISNIMEFISETNLNNDEKANKADIDILSSNDVKKTINSQNNEYKLNLLNEIDSLKIQNTTNENDKNSDSENNLSNYLSDSLRINDNTNNDEKSIDEYLIINKNKFIDNKNSKIEQNKITNLENKDLNDVNETINLEDIDFGTKIEELNIDKIKKTITQVNSINGETKKKIIKIGKKKNK